METNKHEQTWRLCFGIIYFIVLASLTANVIVHESKIGNNAKQTIITPVNKKSYNIKDETHKKRLLILKINK